MPVPDEEFYRWYGTWAPVSPTDAAGYMDGEDLERILPHLSTESSERLRAWLELVHPGHRWLARLSHRTV